ncbi:hypothetical protein BDF20DRAFT_915540 [Mycotypha africana]|uniref:uncharacterized protein n=1 Tax=Mycotypha africana TaxID=64632 RepID=UPI00230102B6|nr:uncharacterized protein BDF20DRAFT_915540 [Mycotypha africana]KAI8971767.1 hypothetical protein BDF20DRAFT_915540 [Mycotypha africana]
MSKGNKSQLLQTIESLSYTKLEKYHHLNGNTPMYKYVLVTNLLRDSLIQALKRQLLTAEPQELEQKWFDNCFDELQQEQLEKEDSVVNDNEQNDEDKRSIIRCEKNAAEGITILLTSKQELLPLAFPRRKSRKRKSITGIVCTVNNNEHTIESRDIGLFNCCSNIGLSNNSMSMQKLLRFIGAI